MPNPKITDQTESEELFESEYDDGGPWYDSFRERETLEEQLEFLLDIELEHDK